MSQPKEDSAGGTVPPPLTLSAAEDLAIDIGAEEVSESENGQEGEEEMLKVA